RAGAGGEPDPGADRSLPPSHLALATRDAPRGHADAPAFTLRPHAAEPRLEADLDADTAGRRASAARAAVGMHPPLRGLLEGSELPLLRRPADGPGLPAKVRSLPARAQGDRGPLDAARADVGGRASTPLGPGFLPVAEHSAVLRADLAAAVADPSVRHRAPGERRRWADSVGGRTRLGRAAREVRSSDQALRARSGRAPRYASGSGPVMSATATS